MPPRTNICRDFQENVLGRITEARQIATIYLRNRMSLRGRVLEYDPYVLLLEPLDGGPAQLVYKSAIVSISGPRTLGGGRGPAGRGSGSSRGGDGPRAPRRYAGEGSDRGYPREGGSQDGERRGSYPPREGHARDGYEARGYSSRESHPEGGSARISSPYEGSGRDRPLGERTFRPPSPE